MAAEPSSTLTLPGMGTPCLAARAVHPPSSPLHDPSLSSGIRMDNSWQELLEQGPEQGFDS